MNTPVCCGHTAHVDHAPSALGYRCAHCAECGAHWVRVDERRATVAEATDPVEVAPRYNWRCVYTP